MEKVIIAGTTNFSTMMKSILEKDNEAEVIAFTVNKEYIHESCLQGIPVVAFEELDNLYNKEDYSILLAIGYSKMNDNRKHFFNACKEKGYSLYTYISKRAIVYSDEIGEGAMILPGSFVGPEVKIGKGTILHLHAYASHNITIGDFCYFAGGSMFGGDVTIGNNCFTGLNSSLKNGITLADRTFVSANSFVNRDTKFGLGYIGSPAVNPKGIKSDFLIKFV